MELILINDKKLKIMLTAEDMVRYDIPESGLSYEEFSTRNAFRSILDEAREKTGFDSTGSIFIQVYPSKSGGCEVYVVKKTNEKNTQCPNTRSSSKKDKSQTSGKKKECFVYFFESVDRVISACASLTASRYTGESSLYFNNSKTLESAGYYLVLTEEIALCSQNGRKKSIYKSDLAAEFGKKHNGREVLMYIKEHCSQIAPENAVAVMGELA